MSRLKKIILAIVLIITLISALLLIVASFAYKVEPSQDSFLALMGLAFPIFVVTTLAGTIALAFMNWKVALIPAVALLISAGGMWRYSPINIGSNKLDPNKENFTLLTYNVLYFMDSDKSGPENHILKYILGYNADVVVLQEAGIKLSVNKGRRFTEELIDQINYIYPYRIAEKSSLILSKYPTRLIVDKWYSETANTTVYEVDINGRKVSIFNNHLESIGLNSEEKQAYREITNQPDNMSENIGNYKDITRKLLNAFETRSQQVEYVDALADSIGGNIILCGDINDTPNSYAYNKLKEGRHDAYLELGTGPGYTYRADNMWVRIDHVFYQGNFKAKHLQIGNKMYSDHYPIFVGFEWQ